MAHPAVNHPATYFGEKVRAKNSLGMHVDTSLESDVVWYNRKPLTAIND